MARLMELAADAPAMADYAAIWQAADKVEALRAGLADECHLFLSPIVHLHYRVAVQPRRSRSHAAPAAM